MSSRTVDYVDGDTITAIATPIGSSGIGIIRISGDRSVGIAKKLFRKEKNQHQTPDPTFLDRLPSHYLTHGYIYDPSNQGIIDEVLLVIMRTPHSYTREDVVEIQSHCGPVILNKILKLVMARGARMALPGEFTRRAFLNGRIDLIQAEAVGEMISAKSENALKLAISHLTGQMKEAVFGVVQKIAGLQVELEAGLEFGDELSNPEIDYEGLNVLVQEGLIRPIERLLTHYNDGYLIRDGIRLGIVGRPNVGKSSLLNYLIRKDKAIVTPMPGTTRDLIEEHINIGGVSFIITDTAGLHATQDPVETIGIQKTRENIDQADLVLFMIDGNQPFIGADDIAFEQIGAKKIVVVINKVDLVVDPAVIPIPGKYASHSVVFVSAKYGQGIEMLKEKIKEQTLGAIAIEPGRTLVPNLRQKLCLESALDAILRVQEAIKMHTGEEFVLMDLGLAKDALNEIIGTQFNNNLLDEIFSRFCIGK
jgi:tRNA modification GTPase